MTRHVQALALLLIVVAAVDVLCMPAVFWPGDPGAWHEETKAMLHGELNVDGILASRFGETGQYFVRNTNAPVPRWYSKYGVMNSIMSLPPMLIDRWLNGKTRSPFERPNLLVFNLYQVFLSLLVCAMLYHLAGQYTSRIATRSIYVLTVLYTTYLWYFQRAQSSEVCQVLFYSAFFYFFAGYLRRLSKTEGRLEWKDHAGLLTAWLFIGLLVLTRILFGLLIPAIIGISALVIWQCGPALRWRVASREAGFLMLPACAVVGTVGWVNWLKFGSPFLTGYHVWRPESTVPTWRYWSGLSGMLFDMQGSILWYFPVLLFALVALRRFSRRYTVDTIAMCGIFGIFFVVLGKIPSWRGDWTYGPRYMLFGLPVLSLPFVTWVDGLLDEPRRLANRVAGAVTVLTLLYSSYLTERQNRLEFFVCYRVSESLEPFRDDQITQYFSGHHTGWISADLLAHRDRLDQLTFMKDLIDRGVPVSSVVEIRRRLKALTSKENYYWRPPAQKLSMKGQ